MGFVFDGCNLIRITFGIWFYFGCLITGPSTLVGLVIFPKPPNKMEGGRNQDVPFLLLHLFQCELFSGSILYT